MSANPFRSKYGFSSCGARIIEVGEPRNGPLGRSDAVTMAMATDAYTLSSGMVSAWLLPLAVGDAEQDDITRVFRVKALWGEPISYPQEGILRFHNGSFVWAEYVEKPKPPTEVVLGSLNLPLEVDTAISLNEIFVTMLRLENKKSEVEMKVGTVNSGFTDHKSTYHTGFIREIESTPFRKFDISFLNPTPDLKISIVGNWLVVRSYVPNLTAKFTFKID